MLILIVFCALVFGSEVSRSYRSESASTRKRISVRGLPPGRSIDFGEGHKTRRQNKDSMKQFIDEEVKIMEADYIATDPRRLYQQNI